MKESLEVTRAYMALGEALSSMLEAPNRIFLSEMRAYMALGGALRNMWEAHDRALYERDEALAALAPEAKNHSYVGHSNIEGFVVGVRLGTSGVSKSAITFSGETDIFKAKALAEKSAIFFSPAYSSVKGCTILGGTVREAYHAYQALSPWRKVWFAFKAALFGARS